jgi:hypothetical protein
MTSVPVQLRLDSPQQATVQGQGETYVLPLGSRHEVCAKQGLVAVRARALSLEASDLYCQTHGESFNAPTLYVMEEILSGKMLNDRFWKGGGRLEPYANRTRNS